MSMSEYEYPRIALFIIPEVIIQQYNLIPLLHNAFVMTDVRHGMYSLPQFWIIVNIKLRKHLATYGNQQVPHTYIQAISTLYMICIIHFSS